MSSISRKCFKFSDHLCLCFLFVYYIYNLSITYYYKLFFYVVYLDSLKWILTQCSVFKAHLLYQSQYESERDWDIVIQRIVKCVLHFSGWNHQKPKHRRLAVPYNTLRYCGDVHVAPVRNRAAELVYCCEYAFIYLPTVKSPWHNYFNIKFAKIFI